MKKKHFPVSLYSFDHNILNYQISFAILHSGSFCYVENKFIAWSIEKIVKTKKLTIMMIYLTFCLHDFLLAEKLYKYLQYKII